MEGMKQGSLQDGRVAGKAMDINHKDKNKEINECGNELSRKPMNTENIFLSASP
jgi:hypothetical protein